MVVRRACLALIGIDINRGVVITSMVSHDGNPKI
jgi:molybdopterin-binding protein